MEAKVIVTTCPVCGGGDFAKFIAGLEGNPTKMLKCTQCGREFKETLHEDCEDCKIK